MFGFLDDVIDTVVNVPGKITEKVVEGIVRVPEAGAKIVKGAIDGVEKGAEKIEDSFD